MLIREVRSSPVTNSEDHVKKQCFKISVSLYKKSETNLISCLFNQDPGLSSSPIRKQMHFLSKVDSTGRHFETDLSVNVGLKSSCSSFQHEQLSQIQLHMTTVFELRQRILVLLIRLLMSQRQLRKTMMTYCCPKRVAWNTFAENSVYLGQLMRH